MATDTARERRHKLIGARIRRARRDAGFSSQEALARALNVSTFTVSRWERGANRPDLDTLYAIAEMLHVRAADLLTDDGDPEA